MDVFKNLLDPQQLTKEFNIPDIPKPDLSKMDLDPCKMAQDSLKAGAKPLNESFKAFMQFLKSIGDEMNRIFPQIAQIFNQLVGLLEDGINLPIKAINALLNDIKDLIKLFVSALTGSPIALATVFILPYVIKAWEFLMNYHILGNLTIRGAIYIAFVIIIAMALGSLYNSYRMFAFLLSF